MAAGVVVGKPVVLQPQQVEDGGVEIVEMNFAIDRRRAGVVGVAVDVAAFGTATGEPEGEAAGVVAGFVFAIAGGEAGSPEFAAPHDERFIE